VVPYATFCFLRDLFGTAEHWRWGVMAQPSKQLLADITSPQKEWHSSILCCYWLQYQLHRQLRQVGFDLRMRLVRCAAHYCRGSKCLLRAAVARYVAC
jgi:hypothetical protein